MTAMQVADLLRKRLGQIERSIPNHMDGDTKPGDPKEPHLYNANAQEHHGKVSVLYVAYQHPHMMSIDDAKKYLKYLMSIKTVSEFKTHWQVLEGR